MSYFREMKLQEIADHFGVTESRVCQLRHEALAALRLKMALRGVA